MNRKVRECADMIFSEPSRDKKIFIDLAESLVEDYSWFVNEYNDEYLNISNNSDNIILDWYSICIDDENFKSYPSYYTDLAYKKLPEGIAIKGRTIPYNKHRETHEWRYFLSKNKDR